MPSSSSDGRLKRLKAAAADAEERKQWAYDNQVKIYHERDLLIRALSKAYPSHLMRHKGSKAGHAKPVVCIQHPTAGQLCWTLMGGDEQARAMFRHLEWADNDWDGHTAAERNERLETL